MRWLPSHDASQTGEQYAEELGPSREGKGRGLRGGSDGEGPHEEGREALQEDYHDRQQVVLEGARLWSELHKDTHKYEYDACTVQICGAFCPVCA